MEYDILKFREINRPLTIPTKVIREQSPSGVTIVTSRLPMETYVQTQQIMHEENVVRLEYFVALERQLKEHQ